MVNWFILVLHFLLGRQSSLIPVPSFQCSRREGWGDDESLLLTYVGRKEFSNLFNTSSRRRVTIFFRVPWIFHPLWISHVVTRHSFEFLWWPPPSIRAALRRLWMDTCENVISFQTDFLNRHGLILDLDKLGNKYRNKYFTAKKYSPQRNVGGEWSN